MKIIEGKIDRLFTDLDGEKFHIRRKLVLVENALHFIMRLFWLALAFWGFDALGRYLAKEHIILKGVFNSDLLYSIFLIPALYALKNSFHGFFESCFVVASKNQNSITVKRGWVAKSYDKLFIKEINNAEVYKTFWGACFGYFQIVLYAVGGVISIPYIKDDEHNNKLIADIMEQIKTNQTSGGSNAK